MDVGVYQAAKSLFPTAAIQESLFSTGALANFKNTMGSITGSGTLYAFSGSSRNSSMTWYLNIDGVEFPITLNGALKNADSAGTFNVYALLSGVRFNSFVTISMMQTSQPGAGQETDAAASLVWSA